LNENWKIWIKAPFWLQLSLLIEPWKKCCENNLKNMGTKCTQFCKSGKFFCFVIHGLTEEIKRVLKVSCCSGNVNIFFYKCFIVERLLQTSYWWKGLIFLSKRGRTVAQLDEALCHKMRFGEFLEISSDLFFLSALISHGVHSACDRNESLVSTCSVTSCTLHSSGIHGAKHCMSCFDLLLV
jgi:hypothetical protein